MYRLKINILFHQMAHYPQPATLEAALPLLSRPDLRLRQQLGEQLTALVRREPEITHEKAAQLLDSLVGWLNGGNFKVRRLNKLIVNYLRQTFCRKWFVANWRLCMQMHNIVVTKH